MQILELEQEIYAEEAKAYLCQYGIADKNKSEVLAKQLKILERARVTSQSPDERNYHIFYQLCAGADENLAKKLHLGPPDAFR